MVHEDARKIFIMPPALPPLAHRLSSYVTMSARQDRSKICREERTRLLPSHGAMAHYNQFIGGVCSARRLLDAPTAGSLDSHVLVHVQ